MYEDSAWDEYLSTGEDPTCGGLDADENIIGEDDCTCEDERLAAEADYVCVDVETANECMSSICSIGLVWVKGNEIVHTFYSLVNPEPDYYNWRNRQVHGLGPCDTDDAPVFSEVWEEVAPLIGDLPLVAHNACFDKKCLMDAFQVYQMDWPDYTFYDTLKGSRCYFGHSLPNHKLDTVAAACGFDLRNHHHALADAEACAHIAMTVWDWKK